VAWCRRNGMPVPADLVALLAAVTDGHVVPDGASERAPDDARAVSVPEAARRLGVSERTVRRRIAGDELSSFLFGGRRLVDDARVVGR
jgi:excisionase family DNA binding protein